ncbi:MAG: glycine cleavage system protein GcvH [Candidatus Gastranaerophilales bacterium]
MESIENALCAKSHEYLLENADKTYSIGITDYAIEQLGDIVYLELPEIGQDFAKGTSFSTVESVKAASEIYMPISGKIVAINNDLVDSPEKLNEDNFNSNWLIKIEATDASEKNGLLSYADYLAELD